MSSPSLSETDTAASQVRNLEKGIYVIGKDLAEGTYVYTVMHNQYGASATLFENQEHYDSYVAADAFTIGEERTAIEQNALENFYVERNKQCILNLRQGMVLKISENGGFIQKVTMSWSK